MANRHSERNLEEPMYTGLWKRESIAFDDGEPQETATVFWLQGEKYFADLRIPLDQPEIPAGQSFEDLAKLVEPKFVLAAQKASSETLHP
jgi:hypothetical protein